MKLPGQVKGELVAGGGCEASGHTGAGEGAHLQCSAVYIPQYCARNYPDEGVGAGLQKLQALLRQPGLLRSHGGGVQQQTAATVHGELH